MYTINHLTGEDMCIPDRHLNANYEQTTFMRSIHKKWSPKEYQFSVLYLDFMCMSSGYTGIQDDHLFKDVIPFLVKEYGLEAVWVPHTQNWSKAIHAAINTLEAVGLTGFGVRSPWANPLYYVTRNALEACGGDPLLADLELYRHTCPGCPFICLQKLSTTWGVPSERLEPCDGFKAFELTLGNKKRTIYVPQELEEAGEGDGGD